MFVVSDESIKRHRELIAEERNTWVKAGQSWAADVAHPSELRALARDGDMSNVLEEYDDVNEFWRDQIGETDPSDEMVKAFVEGAVEAWEQIKQQL